MNGPRKKIFMSDGDPTGGPEAFGLDVSNEHDRLQWQRETGEMPIIDVTSEKPMGAHNMPEVEVEYLESRGY